MIRTGSVGIDRALGGGWKPGTMNEIWGEPGSGKTVLARHTTENAVRAGMHVLWVDLAAAVQYMDNAPLVIVGRPRCAEEAFLMAHTACSYPGIDLVVVDPAQHLVRQRELDGDPDYVPHPQREYRLELNDLKTAAQTHGTTVLFVSRPRDTERQPVRGTGISEKVASRVLLHPDIVHQDGTRVIDAHLKDVAARSTEHNVTRFTVVPGTGIDQARELAVMAAEHDLIERRGDWYWLPTARVKLQGIEAVVRYFRDNPHDMHHLDMLVRKSLGFWVVPGRRELVPS